MFDFRKNHQYFERKYGGNKVYCWKAKNGGYDIGINGTSHHTHAKDKQEAKSKVLSLLSIKG